MASPIFKPMQPPRFNTAVPRAMGAALFMHRMKQQLKPKAKHTANGHPIIHAPIVVRPARPTHTSGTQLY